MENKVKLNPGETLRRESSRTKGTHAQTDIDTYSIINEHGEVVGSVVHTDTTAIKGFKQTQTLVQKNAAGEVVLELKW